MFTALRNGASVLIKSELGSKVQSEASLAQGGFQDVIRRKQIAVIGVGRIVQPPALAIFISPLIDILFMPALIGSLSQWLALLFAFSPHLKQSLPFILYLTISKRNRLCKLFPATSGRHGDRH